MRKYINYPMIPIILMGITLIILIRHVDTLNAETFRAPVHIDRSVAHMTTVYNSDIDMESNYYYTSIESFDSELNQLSEVILSSDDNPHLNAAGLIKSSPEINKAIRAYNEGFIEIDGEKFQKYIYYRWIIDNSGGKRLLVITNNSYELNEIFLIKVLCYIILLLMFISIVIMQLELRNRNIREYKFNLSQLISLIRR
jgi:hypothetical protein|nr:MAG TPA: hypothetical protein [Caudoviricetes sp.]